MKNSQKSPNQKISFTNRFLLGLIISLSFSLTAFEWTTVSNHEVVEFDTLPYLDDDVILDPLRFRIEEAKKPDPIIEKKTPLFEVVDVLTNPKPNVPEINPEPTPEPEPFVMNKGRYGMVDEVIIEEEIYTSAEYFAHYDKCAGLESTDLYQCALQDIINRIKLNFDVPHELKYDVGEKQAYIEFVVDKTGEITNIKVVRTNHPKMGEASVDALKKLPKMNPASQRGKNVALRMTVPITLTINP